LTAILRRIVVLFVILLSFTVLVSSHKSSSQTLEETDKYHVQFGLKPGILVEEQDQQLYFEVTHAEGIVAEGLEATFYIFRDNTLTLKNSDVQYLTSLGLLEGSYDVVAGDKGIYGVSHTFVKKGPYLIIADLYDGSEKVLSIQQHVHVEPNGPSTLFWLYMLLAVITGIYVSTKSYKV
jgi:hypothetical protein